jgi:hypothetical protein
MLYLSLRNAFYEEKYCFHKKDNGHSQALTLVLSSDDYFNLRSTMYVLNCTVHVSEFSETSGGTRRVS